MRKQIFKIILLLCFCYCGHILKAQRSWYGLGVGFKDLSATGAYNYTSGNGGTQTGTVMLPGIYYSNYSCARRGITYSLNPITSIKAKVSGDGTTENFSTQGVSVGIGFFGLIASDYLSKLEVHFCNNIVLGDLPNEFFVMVDIGAALRYRVSKNIKICVDAYPLSYYEGTNVSMGFSSNFRVLFAP
jgi:hypothetical protein